MIKRISYLFLPALFLFPVLPAQADIALDVKNGRPVIVILQNATSGGIAIDAAVAEAVRAMPELAGEIVAAAILLLPALDQEACVVQRQTDDPWWNWRDACEKKIIQVALTAGADPNAVTGAAAAGRLPAPPPAAELGLGTARRHAPVQVPNGGTGGGGIASPS